MQIGSKANMNPDILRQHFYQLLSGYAEFIRIYTDGSKEGVKVAAAMVHKRDVVVQCRLPDHSSIFSAEAKAILLALEFVELQRSDRFVVFSDSLSCLQAIHYAKWSSPFVRDILEKCHFLSLYGKEVHFCWIPSHVGIAGNERADSAAKDALQFAISDIRLPHTDYKQMVKSYFTNIWQTQWNDNVFNKLQPIKGTVGETKLIGISRRRDEVVLHRARLGHTHLTHCFLLKAEEQPQCDSCRCGLTVEHILLTCPAFAPSRKKYFDVGSLAELFGSTGLVEILDYLREIGLYKRF
jgi:ribonuclease HI